MGTLTVGNGFDLHLTDLGAAYAVDVGSERGAALLKTYSEARQATEADMQTLNKVLGAKWPRFPYRLEFDVGELSSLMSRSYDSPLWDQLAEICLACGQCTLVCPTCFCFNVYDEVELNLQAGERWRRWDSCFTLDFSYIHGGSVRHSPRSRYRQWMTHKLASWIDQFDSSGCTGCGRCITWCPVGIDLTAEARAIRESEAGTTASP